MIEGLKPYPKMKDSGVPWLGAVPQHWELLRLKTISSMRSGESITEESIEPKGQYPVYGGNGKRGYTSRYTHDGQFVLIGRQGALCGNVHIASGRFWASEHAVVASLKHGNVTEWFGSFLEAMDLGQHSIAAAQPGLAVERILNLPIAVPPPAEQHAIASFLSRAQRRIRRYIHAKQKLIKLLEEQKQAVISRAVTRGLDTSVRLKPSGVEWLGYVPEHWEVKRAKAYLREVDERSSSGSEELLSVSHITGVTPRSAKNVTMFKPESYVGHKLARKGDLVINTMWAWAGAVGVSPQLGIVSPSYAVYRAWSPALYEDQFIDAMLRTPSYVNEYVGRSTGIRKSRLRLYPEQFLRIPLLRPPLEDQRRILTI